MEACLPDSCLADWGGVNDACEDECDDECDDGCDDEDEWSRRPSACLACPEVCSCSAVSVGASPGPNSMQQQSALTPNLE